MSFILFVGSSNGEYLVLQMRKFVFEKKKIQNGRFFV